MNGISALRKEPQSFLDFPLCEDTANQVTDIKSAVDYKQHMFIVVVFYYDSPNGMRHWMMDSKGKIQILQIEV